MLAYRDRAGLGVDAKKLGVGLSGRHDRRCRAERLCLQADLLPLEYAHWAEQVGARTDPDSCRLGNPEAVKPGFDDAAELVEVCCGDTETRSQLVKLFVGHEGGHEIHPG